MKNKILSLSILLLGMACALGQPMLRGPLTTNDAVTQLTLLTNAATNAVTIAVGPGVTIGTNTTTGRTTYTIGATAYKLFTMTNLVTVSNTVAAASLMTNTLWGSQVIAANTLQPGSVIVLAGYGYHTSPSSSPITIGLRSNAGAMMATNVLAIAATAVNDAFYIYAEVIIQKTGASGIAYASGGFGNPAATGGANSLGNKRLQFGGAAGISTTVTVDTTANLLLDFFVTPAATTQGFTLAGCYGYVLQ